MAGFDNKFSGKVGGRMDDLMATLKKNKEAATKKEAEKKEEKKEDNNLKNAGVCRRFSLIQ